MNRLMGAFSAERTWPQMVHIATDGETYGHHHQFGEMALAYALHSIELQREGAADQLWRISGKASSHARGRNLGKQILELPARCRTMVGKLRLQHRRASRLDSRNGARPLRKALDWLRDRLESVYEAGAAACAERSVGCPQRLYRCHSRPFAGIGGTFSGRSQRIRELNAEERVRVLKLQELQRHAMLMYTSCGWFFDDISEDRSNSNPAVCRARHRVGRRIVRAGTISKPDSWRFWRMHEAMIRRSRQRARHLPEIRQACHDRKT